MTRKLKIAMLGASGVGKTSLLTAMYKSFAHTISKTNLQFKPTPETFARLEDRLLELKGLSDDFEALAALQTTDKEFDFIFDLAKKGKEGEYSLIFTDYPGSYLGNKEFMKNLLSESDVVLIAIDSPALMERNARWNENTNSTKRIINLFENFYTNLKSPKLVLFVPLRCETYLQDNKSARNLIKSVKEKYCDLLGLFASPALSPWVASAITPVQTVGNVILKSVSEKDGRPIYHFSKISFDAEYSPKNSELPLSCILRFMLKRELDCRNWNWGIYSPIRASLGLDNHLREVSIVMTNFNTKYDEWGYTLLQEGKKLLTIE